MADNTGIQWTEAALSPGSPGKKCRVCRTVRPLSEFSADRSRHDGRVYVCRACVRTTDPREKPNRTDRGAAKSRGLAWCSVCKDWLPASDVTKQGLCRHHQRLEDRRRYAADPEYRHRRRQHAHSRRRGCLPLPPIAAECLTEEFEGRCAYCEAPATTWDHITPVARGGETLPRNVVPACGACNSSKKSADVWEWLAAKGRTPHERFCEHALGESLLGGGDPAEWPAPLRVREMPHG